MDFLLRKVRGLMQHVVRPTMRIKTLLDAWIQQRVHDGHDFGGLMRTGKQIVLSSDGNEADRIYHRRTPAEVVQMLLRPKRTKVQAN